MRWEDQKGWYRISNGGNSMEVDFSRKFSMYFFSLKFVFFLGEAECQETDVLEQTTADI